MINRKFLNRWADIFIAKLRNEGPNSANEWANRTFDEEILKELIPVIQEKRNGKKG